MHHIISCAVVLPERDNVVADNVVAPCQSKAQSSDPDFDKICLQDFNVLTRVACELIDVRT